MYGGPEHLQCTDQHEIKLRADSAVAAFGCGTVLIRQATSLQPGDESDREQPCGVPSDRRTSTIVSRGRRQHEKLAAHGGLMLHALEIKDALFVKREKIGRLFKRRQIYIHQNAEVGTQQSKVVIVIRLEIPKGDKSRF